jgi:MFS family permease
VLSYAFAVLLVPMQQALRAGPAAVTGALTGSLLAAAVAAVPVGRWLDRHGGRALMTGGSVLATLLVAAWSQVRTVAQLYLVLAALGIVSAAVLYEAAFAVVVSWFPPAGRARALLAITIVAGFASSVFLPLTGALVQAHGWRTALLVLAAVHGAVTVPLHLRVRRPPTRPAPAAPARRGRAEAVRSALRDRGYWLLAAVFVGQAAAVAVISVHLVAYLRDLGHSARFAASVAGLLGVLSVTGRIAVTGASRRWPTGRVVAGVLAFAFGFGVATLARPTLLADRYGVTGYATIAGVLAVPLTIAKATAPLGASLVRGAAGGYGPVAIAVAAACVLAAVGLAALPPGRLAADAPG